MIINESQIVLLKPKEQQGKKWLPFGNTVRSLKPNSFFHFMINMTVVLREINSHKIWPRLPLSEVTWLSRVA